MVTQFVVGLSSAKPLVFLALVGLALALVACTGAQAPNARATGLDAQAEVPPMDREVPAEFRTATFAMG